MAEILVPHTPTTTRFQLHTRPPGSSTAVIVDDYLSIQTTESLEDVNTHTYSSFYNKTLKAEALGKRTYLTDGEKRVVDDN